MLYTCALDGTVFAWITTEWTKKDTVDHDTNQYKFSSMLITSNKVMLDFNHQNLMVCGSYSVNNTSEKYVMKEFLPNN